MKKLLFLLLFPIFLHAQTVTTGYPSPSEYTTLWLKSGQVYVIDNSIPTLLAGQPSGVTAIAAGMHANMLLDAQGRPWVWGDNQNGNFGDGTVGQHLDAPELISTDADGNWLSGIKLIAVGTSNAGYYSVIVKSDGSAWYAGNLFGSNVTKFTQLSLPAGTVIVQASAGPILALRDANGGVWTAGYTGDFWAPQELAQGPNPNGQAPGKISLPAQAVDISVGGYSQATHAYALLSNGQLAAWGYRPDFYGMSGSGPATSPVTVNILGLPSNDPIAEIHCNTQTSAVITKSRRLFTWGDNAMGNIGNGVEINYATFQTPYAWDWGVGDLMQLTAVEPAPGLRFAHIWGSANLGLDWFAQDVNGNYFSWGRNKGLVLGNGIEESDQWIGGLGANYPNSWDVPLITRIDPFALTDLTLVTSPVCISNPSATSCPGYGQPAGSSPTATASVSISGSTAQLRVATAGSKIIRYIWTQTSGPNTPVLTLPSDANPVASGLIAGTYTFLVQVMDQNLRTASAKVSFTVAAPAPNQPPVAVIAPMASQTLPADTIQVDGSGSTDPSGTIVTYTWSVSGPPAVLVPNGAKATIYATAAGTYTVKLTVTDNAGASASSTSAVMVDPYPGCGACPPPVICPVPRTVTSLSVNLFGTWVTVPLASAKFTFSDGSIQ